MVDRDKLAQRLMTTFLDELNEHVSVLNRELLALEAGPAAEERDEIFTLLFRAAHSLKGASRAVNVDLLEQVCHRLEDILDASRLRSIDFTPHLFGLLFKTVDGIDDAGTQLRQSKDLTNSPLVALLPELEEAAATEREAAAEAAAIPTPVAEDQSYSETTDTSPSDPETSNDALQPDEPIPSTTSTPLKPRATSTVRVASENSTRYWPKPVSF